MEKGREKDRETVRKEQTEKQTKIGIEKHREA